MRFYAAMGMPRYQTRLALSIQRSIDRIPCPNFRVISCVLWATAWLLYSAGRLHSDGRLLNGRYAMEARVT
jgi:hypothetical protein